MLCKVDFGVTNFFNIYISITQSCILPPFLFLLAILCFAESNKLIKCWNSLNHTKLTDLDFADNVDLLAEISASLQDMTTNSEIETRKAGLCISADKSKIILIGSHPLNTLITTGQWPTEHDQQFRYFSNILSQDVYVKHRTVKASAIYQHDF